MDPVLEALKKELEIEAAPPFGRREGFAEAYP